MRPSDFSIIHLENEFSFMYDMPGLPVSQALLCHVEKYFQFLHFVKSLLTLYSLQIPINFSWLYGLLY